MCSNFHTDLFTSTCKQYIEYPHSQKSNIRDYRPYKPLVTYNLLFLTKNPERENILDSDGPNYLD